jgi:2-methylisocitrate lyase-like PEP mutase family enzyme
MIGKNMKFNALHHQDAPLIICNVWDVASSKIAEKLNFKVIGTSSAAIASSRGYDDGEEMSFEELCYVVKRILANTALPLTVDVEAGYSKTPAQVYKNIIQLAELGVVGINIEDSIVEDGVRSLVDKEVFTSLVNGINKALEARGLELFINVRTDTFLLGIDNVLQESLERIKRYNQAGANGIFIPCITEEDDISTMVKSTHLPVNVMCMPKLPNFHRLKALGVKRISMGNFIFDHMMANVDSLLSEIIEQQTFESIF